MKKSFEEKMDETRTEAAQITCWCITIALHQEFGVGATRLDRLAERINTLEEANISVMMQHDTQKAQKQRQEQLQGKVTHVFQVPLTRAPRGRKEQQMRIARDAAASTAWQLYAGACIDILGYGPERLERLRQAARSNWAQFNGWAQENGIEVAMEWLRRCAEDALKEKCEIVEDDSAGWNKFKDELRSRQELANRVAASSILAVSSAPTMPLDKQRDIFESCMAATLASGGIAAMRR